MLSQNVLGLALVMVGVSLEAIVAQMKKADLSDRFPFVLMAVTN